MNKNNSIVHFSKMALSIPLALTITAALALPGIARAQAYPNKSIRLIVPFAPGGGTDILGRVIGAKLSDAVGQQVVVENRPGAGSSLGAAMAATAPGDGYTILIVSASYAVNAAVFKLSFDPLKDLVPVVQIASVPFVLNATVSLPANNIKELIALAQAKPGTLNYASSGTGSSPHLAGELLAMMTKTKMVHVPYKGGGPVMSDLIAGQTQLYFGTVTLSAPLIKAGKLKPLGIGGLKRATAMPEIATIDESGVPGFDITNWFGILAPGTTPKPLIAQINKQVNGLLSNSEVRSKLAAEGADPIGGTPEDFDKLIRGDIEKFVRIVKEANVKVE
jgi:tripartite-type tricarboxylate transporter receptor subunit TctC